MIYEPFGFTAYAIALHGNVNFGHVFAFESVLKCMNVSVGEWVPMYINFETAY